MHTSMLLADLMMTALVDWQSGDTDEVLQESRLGDVLMMAGSKVGSRKAA